MCGFGSGGTTVNGIGLMTLAKGVSRAIGPVVASKSTRARSSVLDTISKAAAAPAPKVTRVTSSKSVPVIVTTVAGLPVDGEKVRITGTGWTTKGSGLWPDPTPVVTVTGPVVAPSGTMQTI